MNVWTESGGTQKARIKGEGSVKRGPRPRARTGRLAPCTCTDSWSGHPGARARVQDASAGTKQARRARAGASSGGTRNAFAYLSLCLELLPGMRPPPPPGAPECARAWVRACVYEILAVRLTYCSRRHCPLPTKEWPPSPLPALPAPPSCLPPPLLQPSRLPASEARGPYLCVGLGSPWAPPRSSGQRRLSLPACPPARRCWRFPGSRLLRPSVARRTRLLSPLVSLLVLASRLQSPSCRLAAPTCPGYGACPVRRARAGLGVGRDRAGRRAAARPRGWEGAPGGPGGAAWRPGPDF